LKQLSSLLKISVSSLFIFLHLTASGGDPYHPSAGAGEAGMGYACIVKEGFWTSFHNQALLADNQAFSFAVNYENRFNIKELGTRSLGLKIPTGKASIGVIYSHFGFAGFKRQMAGLSCGMKISEKLTAGVQIDYFSEKTYGEYNNIITVTAETGLIFKPSESTRIGIHLFNPVPNSIRKTSLPTTIRVGAGTDLSKVLFAGAEIEMSSGKNLFLRTGFEYAAANKLWLRAGFCTNNTSFSFGLGYLTKIARIDFGFSTHDNLGVTTSISIIFRILKSD
jgi:hypothetical protein